MQGESMAAAKVRFCVLGFHDDSRCHLELADFRNVEVMPTLGAYNSTSFAAIFRDLKSRIPGDVAKLKSESFIVNRPAIFFLTDGHPNPGEGWESAHAELTSEGMQAHPNILAFGVGDADEATIKAIATKPEYAFIADASMDTGDALKSFMIALTQSVINSGQGLAGGRSDIQVEKPEGFISLELDTV
jgi:uncharacterized protein YegL